MGRSIWSVVAGVLFVVIASTLVDVVLHRAGVYAPMPAPLSDKLAVLALSYRVVIGVVAGWLTAKLAPRNPMKHAMVLGSLGTVLGLVGVAVSWNTDMGPRWYAIALAAFAIPQSWLGGKLFARGRGNS
jgi:hypothetical protein